MAPTLIRYPLDPTGASTDNFVASEPHTMPRRAIRAIAPTYGAFYTSTLKVWDATNLRMLTKNVDYYAAELYEVPTARFGKEVCAIVVITNTAVGDTVNLSYQAVGGEFSTSVQTIIQQLENLDLDSRPLAWGSVIDKPSEYTPSHHLHDLGDVYGFEYVVHALDRVRAAILMGDVTSHDEIYSYIDLVLGDNAGVGAGINTALNTHVNRRDNPHGVTLAQLNAYSKGDVDAMVNQARADLRADYLANISAHNNRRDNPHGVTKDQIGLGNVPNIPIASYEELRAGSQNDRIMTPLTTALAIGKHIELDGAGRGAHDGRYIIRDGSGIEGSIHAPGNGYIYVWANRDGINNWRPFWPPQWQ